MSRTTTGRRCPSAFRRFSRMTYTRYASERQLALLAIRKRPAEAGQAPYWGKAAGAEAAAHEHHGHRRLLDERAPRFVESAVPQRCNNHCAALSEDAIHSECDERRLRNGAGEALQRERRTRKHPARITLPLVGLDAQQLERQAMRARKPCAELERGPFVSSTSERNQHGSNRIESALPEHERDVARRCRKQ